MTDPDLSPILERLAAAIDRQSEALARLASAIEDRVAPALERLAGGAIVPTAAPDAGPPEPARTAGLVRRARDAGDWSEAADLIAALAAEFPTESVALAEALDRERAVAADGLRARLDAARAAKDPEGVIDLRDQLARVLPAGPLRGLDRTAAKWVMAAIQKRLFVVPMPPDVPALVARAAESFAATPEGASLRKALPTLRRAAGLCARCAKPYAGIDDACDECLAAAPRLARAAPEGETDPPPAGDPN